MKKNILKKTALILLFFLILITQILLYRIWNEQNQSKTAVSHSVEESLKPNQSLLYTNQATKEYLVANTNFNEYLLKHNPANLEKYKSALATMAVYLDSLSLLSKTDTDFSKIINQKKGTEQLVTNLQLRLDSLIELKNLKNRPQDNINFAVKKYDYNKILSSITYDTVKKVTETKKKGVFGRIGNALKGKSDIDREEVQSVIKMVFQNQEKSGSFEDQLKNSFQLSEEYYINNLKTIKNTYEQLKNKDYQLLTINTEILNKSQELLLLYTTAAQENIKDKYYYNSKKYKTDLISSKKTIVTLLILTSIATILLLFYTIYAFIRENNLSKAKELAEINLTKKNQLIGMLSHEMRAPLNIISNFSKKLKTQNSNEELSPIINSLHFASNSLQITVSQILDFFKNENNKLKLYHSKINLHKEIKPIIDSLKSLSETKNIEIISNLDNNINIEVWADNVKIHQLFYNIIVNAIKFTDQGSITVKAEMSKFNDKHRLEVSITDTGVGIPDSDIKNVFDKFYQSSSHQEQMNYGAGLGLNLCKNIIELFDGEITVESKLNIGTTVSFYLLLEPLSTDLETFETQLTSKLKDKQIKIAVVDDDTMTLKVIKKLLSKVGFEVYTFERAPEITTFLSNEIVDIIISDIQIFDYSGIELSKDIKKINNQNNTKPIIALTGDSYLGTVEISTLGFDEILIKPVNKEEFYQKLLKILD
jgi:signal transduction histidine kinase/CHASE3 domain sensor protein